MDQWLKKRDAGPCPHEALSLIPRLVKHARDECADLQNGGLCVRRGDRCLFLIDPPRRCRFFENFVLPLSAGLEAEARPVLSGDGRPAKLNGRDSRKLQIVCDAIDQVLDRQRWVAVEDIVRITRLPRTTVDRLMPAAIEECALRKHRRGRQVWRLG